MKTILHFSRFEFKYLLRQEIRKEIEQELAYFVSLDPYVAQRESKSYFVRSLYFDDPGYGHYYEKIDGMLHREKFRLRTYTDNPGEACATFLEIKGRHDALVFKHRAELGTLTFSRLADQSISSVIEQNTNPGNVLDGFRYNSWRRNLRPVVRIDYHRRPYISRFNPDFRLTFDDRLAASATRSLFPTASDQTIRIRPGDTVLEVKLSHHTPSWFHRIIQAYNLRRISFSKYCEGVDVLNLAPRLE